METADMKQRLSAPERRASILLAAQRLFAERGFHGVTVDEIVQAVGVSPAVLYRHFGSKEDLYRSVLESLSGIRDDYVQVVVDSDGSFDQVLQGITHVFVGSIAWQPDLLQMELQAQLAGDPEAEQFFANRWKTFSDYVAYTLGELQDEGRIPPCNIGAATLMYQGMIREALISKCMEGGDRFPDKTLNEMVDALIELFLRAVGYRQPSFTPG